jgi:hypothetical protein
MMFYITDKAEVFSDADGGGYVRVSITAKDKVITTETRELESVEVSPVGRRRETLEGAFPLTLDEVIAKFAISEKNPLVAKVGKGNEPA